MPGPRCATCRSRRAVTSPSSAPTSASPSTSRRISTSASTRGCATRRRRRASARCPSSAPTRAARAAGRPPSPRRSAFASSAHRGSSLLRRLGDLVVDPLRHALLVAAALDPALDLDVGAVRRDLPQLGEPPAAGVLLLEKERAVLPGAGDVRGPVVGLVGLAVGVEGADLAGL